MLTAGLGPLVINFEVLPHLSANALTITRTHFPPNVNNHVLDGMMILIHRLQPV